MNDDNPYGLRRDGLPAVRREHLENLVRHMKVHETNYDGVGEYLRGDDGFITYCLTCNHCSSEFEIEVFDNEDFKIFRDYGHLRPDFELMNECPGLGCNRWSELFKPSPSLFTTVVKGRTSGDLFLEPLPESIYGGESGWYEWNVWWGRRAEREIVMSKSYWGNTFDEVGWLLDIRFAVKQTSSPRRPNSSQLLRIIDRPPNFSHDPSLRQSLAKVRESQKPSAIAKDMMSKVSAVLFAAAAIVLGIFVFSNTDCERKCAIQTEVNGKTVCVKYEDEFPVRDGGRY